MKPRIDNWSISSNDNGFTAPERIKYYVHGYVYGHPNFNDGDPVTTAYILELDVERRYVKTKSREYELGTINPDYQKFLEKSGSRYAKIVQ